MVNFEENTLSYIQAYMVFKTTQKPDRFVTVVKVNLTLDTEGYSLQVRKTKPLFFRATHREKNLHFCFTSISFAT